MGRVCGPYKGYFIAVYACEMGELGHEFLGYYKICRSLPECYWEADCVLKDCTVQIYGTPEQAMAEAEQAARSQIGNMPVLANLGKLRRYELSLH